jgi:hypothetical protein
MVTKFKCTKPVYYVLFFRFLQLILLVKELARKPILSKLELDGNDISTKVRRA